MNPVLSVVIATWQRPGLLKNCVEALVNQNMEANRYEVVIVTDGPDPETRNFMNRWLENYTGAVGVRCLENPVKKGPASARNLGWRNGSGELIVFTDDDCVPQPDCLQQYWEAYSKYRGFAVAFSGRVIVPLNGTPTDYEMNTWRLEQARFITANCACSRLALEMTGGLDEEFTMAWREDTALEFDLLKHEIPILKVPTAQIVHPVRPANFGVSIREQRKGMFNALLYKKHADRFMDARMERPPRYYYIMVTALFLGLVFLLYNRPIALIFLMIWAGLTAMFTWKRLRNTSKRVSHLTEMLYTSAVIPVLSVYWTIYGAVKFKTLYV